MFNFKRNQVIITVLVFMIAIAAYLNTQEEELTAPLNVVQDDGYGTFGYGQEEEDPFSGYDEIIEDNTSLNELDYLKELEEPLSADGLGEQEVLSEDVVGDESLLEEGEAILPSTGTDNYSFDAVITKKNPELSTEIEGSEVASQGVEIDYFAEEKLLREQSRASQVEQLSQYVANENLDADTKAKAAENLLEIQERIEKESGAEALLRAKGFKDVYVRIDNDGVDVVISKTEITDTDVAQIEEIVNRKTGYSVGKIRITPLNGKIKSGS